MSEIITIAQAGAVIAASWAIISGIGAWRREFIGKRKIDLAEQVLAKFFEVGDAIAFIRNPFASISEGQSRQKNPAESPQETELLNRGYVVIERYQQKEKVFSEFWALKYKFMASFGKETEDIFRDTNRALNEIFGSARMLTTIYWPRQGRSGMSPEQFQKHVDEMFRHEGIFWDSLGENDEIRKKLSLVLTRLEQVTAPCFQEPMSSYEWLTKRLGRG